jgi:hypothetical protein
MVNLVVSLSIKRCPSAFMNVGTLKFDSQIFGCGKVYYSNSIIVTMYIVGEGLQRPQHRDHLWSIVHIIVSSFVTLIPNCLFVNIRIPYLIWHWNFPTKWSYCIEGIIQIHVLIPHRGCPSCHQFYSLLGHKRSEQWYYTSDLLVLCMTIYH